MAVKITKPSFWWWIDDRFYIEKDHPDATPEILKQFKEHPQLTKVELQELCKRLNVKFRNLAL